MEIVGVMDAGNRYGAIAVTLRACDGEIAKQRHDNLR